MMTLDTTVSLLTLVVLVVSVLWGGYIYSRQMNAQLFLAFTARFESVMKSLSESCGDDYPLDIFECPPKSSPTLTASTVQYLNLCSEEFYLWKRKFLSPRIWAIWQCELERTLSSKLLEQEWPKIKSAYDSYPEFQRYVDSFQSKPRNVCKGTS